MHEYFDRLKKMNAYKTSFVPNFPNLFLVFGPRGQAGANTLGSIEVGQDHIVRVLKFMRENGIRTLEVKEEVNRKYNDKIDRKTAIRVPTLIGCHSYYVNRYGQALGFGDTMMKMQKVLSVVDPNDYNLTYRDTA